MTRTLPLISSKPLDPSPLPLSLLSAFFILTIITLIFALCASHHRRPRSPPPTSLSSSEDHEEKEVVVLPATHGPIGPTDPPGLPPRRKLSFSLSLKLTRVRTGRREAQEKERTAEDSTWMKTIILGEKCKVPDENNGEQEGDEEEVIVYDDKGKRQRNYHPRTPRSMPVSRTNSFVIHSS